MRVTLVTGGARSGKSRFAQERAHAAGGADVTFIATAVVTDAEMESRIARHRIDRPAAWCTIEAPLDAANALNVAASPVVLLDCLTLLVSNALLAHAAEGEEAATAAAARAVEALLEAAAGRDGQLIVVTNEVGWGVVPEHALARWFRDAAGDANQRVARAAEEVYLLVAGVPVRIAPSGL
jgi:adenosyl cobinamide kinase/adenosyl cobinamide phosphate guanylyltransferase